MMALSAAVKNPNGCKEKSPLRNNGILPKATTIFSRKKHRLGIRFENVELESEESVRYRFH